MEQWQKDLNNALTDPDELAARFGLDAAVVRRVAEVFPFRITRHYLSLIRATRSTCNACRTNASSRRPATSWTIRWARRT